MPPARDHLIRSTLDSAGLMDRGGRPTVRELLAGLEFDASSGALRLNGERVALYLAEADRILRRELIQRLGEAEARVFLLRRGFRMGQHDAAFVAASWPHLDRGDAFTAGTRLHMFSGIVRVETVHNDFDFARGRFSAEFLWHNSIEAEDALGLPRASARPACWQQVGYASGYASFFFGSLVVYKETACAAQGHRACRVVGKLAGGWGEDDEDVILFRSRVVPPLSTAAPPAPPGHPPETGPDKPEAALLAPVLARLDLAARLPLPCLIAGPGNVGQEAALSQLLQRLGTEPPLRLRTRDCSVDMLAEVFAARRKPGLREPPVVLDGIEDLAPQVQPDLARLLAQSLARAEPSGPRLIALSGLSAPVLASVLHPGLWARLSALVLDLPALSQRAGALPDLAARLLPDLAGRLGLAMPSVEEGAFAPLDDLPPPAGLDGVEALLTAILVETLDGAEVTAALVRGLSARLAPPLPAPSGDVFGEFGDWLDARFQTGAFSLPAHEACIREAAIERAGGNMAAAARLLGISRAQLAYRQKAEKG